MKYLLLLFLFSNLNAFSQRDTCIIYASMTILPWCCSTSDCDKFKIYSDCPIDDFDLKIYTKWGVLVFETKDQDEFWVPERINYKLVDLDEGEYVWILKGKMNTDFDLDGVQEYLEFEKGGKVFLIN